MTLIQIVLLAVIQGAAELLPVSSSAHVIMAEKFMGLDPSAPEMTFLLVMLHTGTMLAVLFYFWPRWKKLDVQFLKMVLLATACTGVIGLSLKVIIEKVVLGHLLGESHAEIEHLFKSLPLIAASLFLVGILICIAGVRSQKKKSGKSVGKMNPRSSFIIGISQGLCLPFRGFSRSGTTISTALLSGIPRGLAEDFSFALAVVLTPPVVLLELHRLLKSSQWSGFSDLKDLLMPGFLGMILSCGAGFLALKWLSAWLENGKWKHFGVYCILASLFIFASQWVFQ